MNYIKWLINWLKNKFKKQKNKPTNIEDFLKNNTLEKKDNNSINFQSKYKNEFKKIIEKLNSYGNFLK